MKSLMTIIRSLFVTNSITVEGLTKLIEWTEKPDICLQILLGEYSVPGLGRNRVDKMGITWELVSYNPIKDEVHVQTYIRAVYAKSLEDFQKGNHKYYRTENDYIFFLRVSDPIVKTVTKEHWLYHEVMSDEDIISGHKRYSQRQRSLWNKECWPE